MLASGAQIVIWEMTFCASERNAGGEYVCSARMPVPPVSDAGSPLLEAYRRLLQFPT